MSLVFNGNTYKLPEWVLENNMNAEDHYCVYNVLGVFTGEQDFDRIEAQGFDYLESQCFEAYANALGILEDDAQIHLVKDSVYAYLVKDGDDFLLVKLDLV